MKNLFSVLLLCAATAVVGDFVEEKRQAAGSSSAGVASSSTSSVFSVPTPSNLPTVNSSQYDMSQHFCRIWRHQSVYADGKIYIDGGNTYVPDNGTTFNTTLAGKFQQGMNDGLLVLDLSKNFTNVDTFPYSTINKGPQVPNTLIEGALWFSRVTRKVYQIGGWFSFNNQANPGFVPLASIPQSSIWEFDIDKKTWAQSSFSLVNTGNKVDRPGQAANCDAPTLNMSFIFGGFVQQRSDQDYMNYTQTSTVKFEEGMLQLDTTTSPPTLTNISFPNYIGPRINGALVHVPVGPKGVIVNIGGQSSMNPTPFGLPIINGNNMLADIAQNYVDIFDIQTGYWFRQETFGVPDFPPGRYDICAVLVSAQDGSSYNIFMIAGEEIFGTYLPYEEIWVLTLPTFQWKKVHSKDGGRFGHTCHAVGENLLIIGGMETTTGGSNVVNCSTHMPAEIFSLATLNYTGIFDVAGASRLAPVPADIVALIGGTPTGGAVVRAPKVWSDLYLQYVFNPSLVRPAYTPTYQLANVTTNATVSATPSPSLNATASATPNPEPSPGTNVGAIAGGVVGGVVFLIIVAGIVGLCLRRRKRAQAAAVSSELPSYDESKSPAVKVSPGGTDLGFTPYQPFHQSQVVELQGDGYEHEVQGDVQYARNGEGQDQLRPLSTPPTSASPISPPLSAPSMDYGEGAAHSPQVSLSSTLPQTPENVPATLRSPVIQRKPAPPMKEISEPTE